MVTTLMTRAPRLPAPYEATRLLLGHPGHERWAGRDRHLGRRVHVDVWTRSVVEHRADLLQRAQVWAGIGNVAVVPVYVVLEDGDDVIVVQRELSGAPLGLEAFAGALGDLVRSLVPLAESLDAVHATGRAHGSIRPGALVVGAARTTVLSDLGLGRPMGTPAEDRRALAGLVLEVVGSDSARRIGPALEEALVDPVVGGSCRSLLDATGLLERGDAWVSGSFASVPRPDDAPPPVRAIVVEDVPADLLLLERRLVGGAGQRFALRHVERLADLEGAYEDEGADVVLLDVTLPDGQGVEAVARAVGICGRTPIVVVTDNVSLETAQGLVRAGAQDVVNKSEASAPALRRAITFAIERARWGG